MVLALRALLGSAQSLSRRNCQHAKQKVAAPAHPCARGIRASCTAWFLLCFIFQTLNVFEKWRYVPITRRAGSPSAASAGRRESGHRRVMKNEFFIALLGNYCVRAAKPSLQSTPVQLIRAPA